MRMDNLEILNDTLSIFENGSYTVHGKRKALKLTPDELRQSRVFLPKELTDLDTPAPAFACAYSCVNMDSFSLARQVTEENHQLFAAPDAKPILVLNFANAVSPGGGVRHGARAQEEDLCRRSSLLLALEDKNASGYYRYNKRMDYNLSSDAVVITPKVEIIKDTDGTLLDESVIVSVLSCATPIHSYDLGGLTPEQYEQMFYRRILGLLRCAAHLGYRYLVLGAFGCGAFGNDSKEVSALFKKALDELSTDGLSPFERVDFAVLSRSPNQYNFKQFYRYFGAAAPSAGPVFFWHENEPDGYLSNWYPSPFVINDFKYLHMEQYIMARKAKLFHDAEQYTAILRETTPKECKDLGKLVTPFDDAVWKQARYLILLEGLMAKFTQNPALRVKLLSTGEALLVEASPYDKNFGIGLDAAHAAQTPSAQWPGKNILGRALMEVRRQLRELQEQ